MAIKKLIRIRGVVVESHEVVVRALQQVETYNADLADALIGGKCVELGCETTMTLDKKVAKHIPAMELLT